MGAAAGRGRMGALDRAERDAEIQRGLCDQLSEGRGGGGVALATSAGYGLTAVARASISGSK